MRVELRAFFCPCCGARLDRVSSRAVVCDYCGAQLEVDPGELSGQAAPHAPEDVTPPLATLIQRSSPRFEMSLLTQRIEPGRELFRALELSEDRFALLYLRVVDKDANELEVELPTQALLESLEEFGDPGLAAFAALEELCGRSSGACLECIICLFEARLSSARIYSAGTPSCIWWMACEEGRSITQASHHPALEKRMLREQRDYFSAAEPVHLASGDLIVVVSAAFAGRGGHSWDSGLHGLSEILNENLGEDPLRVVTLVKNGFWEKRAPACRGKLPTGPIQVAAVQALTREFQPLALSAGFQQFGSEQFEIVCWPAPGDWLELLPLHDERWVLVWASQDGLEVSESVQQQLRSRILEVLDRRDHGDNENPREAGRWALEGLSLARLAVIQLFDRWGRVKYYRSGWKHPIDLQPRSGGYHGRMQQFDEGGETSLDEGARLFFPGQRSWRGEVASVRDFPPHWSGGKASNLYRALIDHWKIPPGARCLERIASALLSDLDGGSASDRYGLGLVTRKR